MTGIIRWQNDVEKIKLKDIKEHGPYDWVIMGPTCKSLSNASNGPGLLGESKIVFDCHRVLKWCQKQNPKLKYLIENVKMKDQFYAEFCQLIGHEAHLINSGLVTGQDRNRYYWTNFEIDDIKDKGIMLNDILEDDAVSAIGWSKSSRYRDKNGKDWGSPGPGRKYSSEQRFKVGGKSNTLLTGKHCRGQSTTTIVYLNKRKTRKRFLSVRECARLQSISERFDFSVVSENKAFETIGDGWTIEIIKNIFKSGLKR